MENAVKRVVNLKIETIQNETKRKKVWKKMEQTFSDPCDRQYQARGIGRAREVGSEGERTKPGRNND